jgi:hypothetical protein
MVQKGGTVTEQKKLGVGDTVVKTAGEGGGGLLTSEHKQRR